MFSDFEADVWDVIVIGTGMGGGTIGYELARAGKSVLFLERGQSYIDSSESIVGAWMESLIISGVAEDSECLRRKAGRSGSPLIDVTHEQRRALNPVLGAGSGGSTALFGMIMERFFPSDFTPGEFFQGAKGANVPDRWPVSYAEMEPYYRRAEALYRVRAGKDPFRPDVDETGALEPPELSPASAEVFEHFEQAGWHPFHAPVACEFVPECTECLGYICPRGCKRDSVNSCLKPAMKDFQATLLPNCEVRRLVEESGIITGVHAVIEGREITLKAKTVILSAGAIHSPALLMRSGIGNGSGQVGRNLMRHYLDYFVVYPKADPEAGFMIQFSANDLYVSDGQKLGSIKSNGRLVPAEMMAAGLHKMVQEKSPFLARLPFLGAVLKAGARNLLNGAYALVAYVEDLPYEDNRIEISESEKGEETVLLRYRISPEDRNRIDVFRDKVRKTLKGKKFKHIKLAEENSILGHVCGTCRFGDDPASSVLDRNNRVHEVSNLYVVDGSFLPTSGGTNPSLTIAANAIRVADHIAGL